MLHFYTTKLERMIKRVIIISIVFAIFSLPDQAYAALQFVGYASSTGNSANFNLSLTALTGGADTAAREGDLVIISAGFVSTANGNPGVTTAGFTEVADLYASDSDDANLSVNWKIMSSSPDTTVTCLGSTVATNGATCLAHVWRYAANDNPMDATDVEATPNNNVGSSIPDGGAITPVTSGAVVIVTGNGADAAGDTAVTAPTGYGNHVQAQKIRQYGQDGRPPRLVHGLQLHWRSARLLRQSLLHSQDLP